MIGYGVILPLLSKFSIIPRFLFQILSFSPSLGGGVPSPSLGLFGILGVETWRTKLTSRDPKNQLKFIKNSKNENLGEETLEKKSQKIEKLRKKH